MFNSTRMIIHGNARPVYFIYFVKRGLEYAARRMHHSLFEEFEMKLSSS